MPRITPPPKKAEVVVEAEIPPPEKQLEKPKGEHRVGAWMGWRVAGGEVIEGKSYLKLTVVSGSDSVLQLFSYDAPHHEEFPSVYARALTQATALADLVNQKLPAQIAIQVEKDGNLLHNLVTQPTEIVITEIDGKNIRGTFSGQVHDIDTGGNGPITGKFQAVME